MHGCCHFVAQDVSPVYLVSASLTKLPQLRPGYDGGAQGEILETLHGTNCRPDRDIGRNQEGIGDVGGDGDDNEANDQVQFDEMSMEWE